MVDWRGREWKKEGKGAEEEKRGGRRRRKKRGKRRRKAHWANIPFKICRQQVISYI